MRHTVFFVILTLFAISSGAEVVKWVDEQGKTHYGDKAPKKYQDQSSALPLDNISVVAPEEKVRRQNEHYADKLNAEDKRRQIDSPTKKTAESGAQVNGNASAVMTREECRNAYSRRLQPKELVLCFRRAEENKKSTEKE